MENGDGEWRWKFPLFFISIPLFLKFPLSFCRDCPAATFRLEN